MCDLELLFWLSLLGTQYNPFNGVQRDSPTGASEIDFNLFIFIFFIWCSEILGHETETYIWIFQYPFRSYFLGFFLGAGDHSPVRISFTISNSADVNL